MTRIKRSNMMIHYQSTIRCRHRLLLFRSRSKSGEVQVRSSSEVKTSDLDLKAMPYFVLPIDTINFSGFLPQTPDPQLPMRIQWLFPIASSQAFICFPFKVRPDTAHLHKQNSPLLKTCKNLSKRGFHDFCTFTEMSFMTITHKMGPERGTENKTPTV